MKGKNKKQDAGIKRKLVAVVILLIVLILCIAGIGVLEYIERQTSGKIENNSNDVLYKTPYGVLRYPGKWKDHIRIVKESEEPLVIAFYGKTDEDGEECKLFLIRFGEALDEHIGKIEAKRKQDILVDVDLGDLGNIGNLSEEAQEKILAMQEDVNYIIQHMLLEDIKKDALEITVPIVDLPVFQDIEIDTTYGKLLYPGEWSDYLQIDYETGVGYVVSFSAKLGENRQVRLFDVSFGEINADSIGLLKDDQYRNVAVNVEIFNLDEKEQMSKDEVDMLYAMQEGMNYLIECLDLATIAEEPELEETLPTETTIADTGVLKIETPYCELHYPSKWEEQLETEIVDNEIYKVIFYCSLPGRAKTHLFTVCFGGDAGIEIGFVNNGKNQVRLVLEEALLEGSWTEEERNIYYAMQEDINLLIDEFQGA